jgi:hypothetical protein
MVLVGTNASTRGPNLLLKTASGGSRGDRLVVRRWPSRLSVSLLVMEPGHLVAACDRANTILERAPRVVTLADRGFRESRVPDVPVVVPVGASIRRTRKRAS